jgi:hypothetical protein
MIESRKAKLIVGMVLQGGVAFVSLKFSEGD